MKTRKMKRTKIKKQKRELKQKNMYREVHLESSGEIPFEILAIHQESVWLSLQIVQTERAGT
jgi:hypothetical protein